LLIEIVPSFLPYGTVQYGPPITTVASLAAVVRMSAQDTVLGQCFSSSAFISSITSKPLNVLLACASLSLPSCFNRMEPSHPFKNTKKKLLTSGFGFLQNSIYPESLD
jgi:hypothetical protein